MKITIETKQLKDALKKLNKMTYKGLYSIMECIKLETENDNVILTKTNLNATVKISLKADIEESGTILLSKSTVKLIDKMKESFVTITDEYILTDKKKLAFKTTDVNEFPDIKYTSLNKAFEVSEKELLRLLEVSYATCKEEARPILTGIHIDNNKFVALDRFRMSVRESEQFTSDLKATICPDFWNILCKLLDKKANKNIEVYSERKNNIDTELIFKYDNIEISGKLIEGNYIDYKQVIPQESETEVNIKDTKELIEEIVFMNNLDTQDKKVKININADKLILESESLENKIETTIDAEIEGNSLEIGFNNKYLEDGLKVATKESLVINFNTAVSPIILKRKDDYKMNLELILPVRLGTAN